MMVRGWFKKMADCQHAIVDRLDRLERNFQGLKNKEVHGGLEPLQVIETKDMMEANELHLQQDDNKQEAI